METGRRRRGIVGPVLIIAVGAIFLLGNMGLLGWNTWEVLFRLWPIALIAVGLELLVGRRSLVWSVVIVLVVAGLIIAALTLTNVPGSQFRPTGYPAAQSESLSQPLGGASRANVEISFGAASVRIAPLSDSDLLIQGNATAIGGQRIAQSFHVSDGTANYSLGSTDGGFFDPFAQRSGGQGGWDLRLNKSVPMALKVNGGVGSADLDLSQLQITDLDARMGVGRTSITLPATGQLQARIDGGIGELNVTIPAGMAARIQVNAGLGGLNVPPGYQKQGNLYVSPGYDTAQNRVDLTVRGGVGRVSIQ